MQELIEELKKIFNQKKFLEDKNRKLTYAIGYLENDKRACKQDVLEIIFLIIQDKL